MMARQRYIRFRTQALANASANASASASASAWANTLASVLAVASGIVAWAMFITTDALADTENTLTIGWTMAPPILDIGPEGKHSGYFVEFANLLGKEIDKEIRIRLYNSIPELTEAQIIGETQMMAGAVQFEVFSHDNVFSQPVGVSRYVLFGLASRLDEFEHPTGDSLKISVLKENPPEVTAYMEGQNKIPIPSAGEGILALLSQDIDAVLFPEDAVQGWTYRSGLDHLILPISDAIAELPRVVVLHKSRAELLPAINSAIAKLEADGSLKALRGKYLMADLEEEPDVLTVAVPEIVKGMEIEPYFIQQENGEYSGFAIELFRELAASAGLKYRFQIMSMEDMVKGPEASGVDIAPLLAIPTITSALADHTLPIEEFFVTATVRRNEFQDIKSLDELARIKLGVIRNTFSHRMGLAEGLEMTAFEPGSDILQALLDGSIDAALETHDRTLAKARRQGHATKVEELDLELYRSERSIALRFGLAQVREKLNTAIQDYLLTDDYITLRNQYFGKPVFWTDSRQRVAMAGLAAAVMLTFAFGSALIMSDRARRRVTAAHQQTKLAHDETERARRDAEILRTQAEERTAETLDATSQLRAVMDAAQSGILGMDRSGLIMIANPLARKMIGLEDCATPIAWPRDVTFFDSDQSPPLTAEESPLNRALTMDHLSGEIFLMSTGSEEKRRSVRLVSTSLPPTSSPEIGTVLVIDDVTDQEHDRMRADRYDRLSMVGQLTGGVAHDFNNLLAIILSCQEILRDDISNPALLKHVDASIGAASRGADLTRSMLAFARKAPLQPRTVDVNDMVEETREWIARTIPSNITVVAPLMENLWSIQVDVGAAESALLNLILNACDAMPDGGTLIIRTNNVDVSINSAEELPDTIKPGPHVVLSVTDSGVGIASENLTRIFEPFFTTKVSGKGSGLGLSMIQGFMEQSGGGATVLSRPGLGTTFKLYFPAGTNIVEADTTPTVPNRVESTGQRILLVEDNRDVQAVLEVLLSNAGYLVTTANSGDQALTLIEQELDVDLLLTDVMMPGTINGIDLIAIVNQRLPELPTITMSGYAEASVAEELTGSSSFQLSKPVTRSDLLATVNEALEGAFEGTL